MPDYSDAADYAGLPPIGARSLQSIPTGARVRKPSAIPFDFAFGREGTVVREYVDGRLHEGVCWDGSDSYLQYAGDTILVECPLHK
jgi:hypothetical protein